MKLQFIGSGDAFGSGGRFNTCFHLTGNNANCLIDCGASSMIALKKFRVDINQIQTVLFTHFHADHFGGLPFFMLESQFFSKRTTPLVIAGPEGIHDWYVRVMETAFPGSSKTKQKFDLEIIEMNEGEKTTIGEIEVTPYKVHHGNPGGPFFALRVSIDDKVIAYTGDTEWTESLVDAAKDADLFVAEAYFRDKKVPLHLDLETLESQLPRINPKRLILTHMSDEMLRRLDELNYETAEDGMIVSI